MFFVFSSLALLFLVVVVVLLIVAAVRKRTPGAATIVIGVLVLVFVFLSGWAFESCSGRTAPPHLDKPDTVGIGYTKPCISPDLQSAVFIKTVSQQRTEMRYVGTLTQSRWEFATYPQWSRFYLCRSSAKGLNPVVVSELPAEQFVYAGNIRADGPTVWWPAIIAIDVSWAKQKAVAVVMLPKDNVHIIDLGNGRMTSCTLNDPMSTGYSGLRAVSLELILNGSVALLSAYNEVLVLSTLTDTAP